MEPFNYTPTQQTVTPQSTAIQIQPNTSTANALSNLTNIYGAYQQVKTQQYQNEAQIEQAKLEKKQRIEKENKQMLQDRLVTDVRLFHGREQNRVREALGSARSFEEKVRIIEESKLAVQAKYEEYKDNPEVLKSLTENYKEITGYLSTQLGRLSQAEITGESKEDPSIAFNYISGYENGILPYRQALESAPNMEAIQEALTAFRAYTDNYLEGAPNFNGEKGVINLNNELETKYANKMGTFLKSQTDKDLEDATQGVATSLFFSPDIPPENRAGNFTAWVDYLVQNHSGYATKVEASNYVAETVIGAIKNNIVLDQNNIEGSYGQLAQAEAYIRQLTEFDRNLTNKDVIVKGIKDIQDLKGKMDSVVKETINQSISLLDKETFDMYYEHAKNNGVYSDVELSTLNPKFSKAVLKSPEYILQTAAALAGKDQGQTPTALITNSKIKSAVEDTYSEKVVRQFQGLEAMEPTFIRNLAINNPSIVQPRATSTINRFINEALNQVVDDKNTTNEEKQQVIQNAIGRSNAILKTLGIMAPTEAKRKVSIVQTLLLGETPIQNIKEALHAIGNPDEFTLIPTSNTLVQNLREEMPLDQFNKAHEEFSILVKSGLITEEDAYESVVDTYGFEEINSYEAKISKPALMYLTNNGITANRLEAFDLFMRGESENSNIIPPDEKAAYIRMMESGRVTLQLRGNALLFKNENNETYKFMFNSEEEREAIVKGVTDIYDEINTAGFVETVTYDVMSNVSSELAVAYDRMSKLTTGVLSFPTTAGRIITPNMDILGNSFATFKTDVDKVLLSWYNGELSNEDTKKQLSKFQSALSDGVLKAFTEDVPQEIQDFIEEQKDFENTLDEIGAVRLEGESDVEYQIRQNTTFVDNLLGLFEGRYNRRVGDPTKIFE